MSLIIVEGARKSGKTFLINSQNQYPVFKFDFQASFIGLGLEQFSKRTHLFGLGKEVMLQQLNRDGFLQGDSIIDRGIISNSVWGVLQKRITEHEVRQELKWAVNEGLFKNTSIILVENGTNIKIERTKDLWDFADETVDEERRLFRNFYYYLSSKGVDLRIYPNFFNEESVENFKTFINK